MRRRCWCEKRAGAGPWRLAFLVALGIGLHNLGEGLAIGSAYVLGELSDEERQQVEQHLVESPEARQEVAAIRETTGLLRQALDAFFETTCRHVTGEVDVELFKGRATPLRVRAARSLYSEDLATFGESTDFDQADSLRLSDVQPDPGQGLWDQGIEGSEGPGPDAVLEALEPERRDDDEAPAGRPHVWNEHLSQIDDGEQVHLHRSPEVVDGLELDEPRLRDPCVVHDAPEATVTCALYLVACLS